MKKIVVILLIQIIQLSLIAQVNQTLHESDKTGSASETITFEFPIVKPEEVGISSEQLQNLSDEIGQWVRNGELVGGELLLVKDNKVFFHQAFGWSNKEQQQPVQLNSIWSIKSMTKPFTALAIMMLVDEGKISLTDKVSDYLPDFKGDDNTTVANLITHTTGYNQNYGFEHATLTDWVLHITGTTPARKLGTYHYSDVGFGISGYIVEKVTGDNIETFIKKRTIKQLGLINTTTKQLDDPNWKKNLNDWYVWDHNIRKFNLRSDSKYHPWKFFTGSTAMYSTAMDYAKFMSIFLNDGYANNKQILSSELLNDMMSPQAYKNQIPVYGYGWQIKQPSEDPDKKIIWHPGYDGTRAYAYPSENLTVIYMNQSRSGQHLSALPDRIFMNGISNTPYGSYLSEAKNFDHSIVPISQNKAQEYEGYYIGTIPNSEEQFAIQVLFNNGQLEFRLNSLGGLTGLYRHMAYLGNDEFVLAKIESGKPSWIAKDEVFRFDRNDKKVISVQSFLNGNKDLFATKIETNEALSEIEDFKNRKFIDDMVRVAIENKGISGAKNLSAMIFEEKPDSVVIGEGLLNSLGYQYLLNEEFEKAVAVFEMNVEAYPMTPNCFDSLADAWKRKGNLQKAKENYELAFALAKEQSDTDLEGIEQRLNEVIRMLKEKE